MEDWRIAEGWAECQTTGSNRNIHSLTHRISNSAASFAMSVRIARPNGLAHDGGGGFRIGIRSDIDEWRSNRFAKGGMNAGWAGDELVLAGKRTKLSAAAAEMVLSLNWDGALLTLTASSLSDNALLGRLSGEVPPDSVLGNIALVSQFSGPPKRSEAKGYKFRDWKAGGDGFTVTPEQRFGPILWSMYSLSDTRGDEGFVLKLSALTGPLGEKDNHDVELTVQRNGQWESLGIAELDPDAWVATFRIPRWNEKTAVP